MHTLPASGGARESMLRRVSVFAFITCLIACLAVAIRLPGKGISRPIARSLSRGISPPPALGVSLPSEVLDDEDVLRVLASGPIRLVRVIVPWSQVEPRPGHFVWAVWDRRLARLRTYGFIPILVLDTSPRWARSPQDVDIPQAPPRRPEDLAHFARALATRYGEWVTYYQVWNEPNIAPHWGHREADPLGYLRLLQQTALALRKADSDARILSAGLAPTLDPGRVNRNDLAYLAAFLSLGGGEWVDVLAWEPYGFRSPPHTPPARDRLNFRRVELARQLLAQWGYEDLPIWAVAFGWNAFPHSPWEGVGRARQATYAQEAVRWAQTHWPWLAALVWTHAFSLAPPEDPVHGFALWDHQLNPWPVWEALKIFPSREVALPPRSPEPVWLPQARDERWQASIVGDGITLEVQVGPRWHTLWVEVDGRPANALPHVQGRAYLNLYAPRVDRERRVVARGLAPGSHTLTLISGPGDPVWPVWRVIPRASERRDRWQVLGWTLLFGLFVWWGSGHVPRVALDRSLVGRGLLIALGGTLPFSSLPLVWEGRSFFLPEVILQISLVVAGMLWWREGKERKWRPLAHSSTRLVLTWVGALLLAHAWVHREESDVWVATRSGFLYPLGLYVLLWNSGRKGRRAFVRGLVIGGVMLAVWALVKGVAMNAPVGYGVPRLRAFFGSPNHLALVLVRIWPFILLEWAENTGRWRKGIIVGAGLVGFALGGTFSRGAWLLAMPVLLLLWWGRLYERRKWLWLGVVAGGVGLMVYRGGETGQARWLIWQGTARLVKDVPWLGVGLGRFTHLYPRYALPTAWREPLIYHAHNVLLTTATWVGLPTTFMIGVLWARRGRHKPMEGMARAAWVSLWAGLAFGLVDAFWALADLAYLTAVALALLSPPHSNQ